MRGTRCQGTPVWMAWLDWPAMPAVVDEAARSMAGRLDVACLRSHASGALLALLITLIALQRGGYFPESWGLPTAACGWAIALAALLGDRQRLRPFEFVQLASLGLLGVLALVSGAWAPGGLGSSLPQAQLLALYLSALTAVYMLFRRGTPLLVAVWASLSIISVLALATRLFPSTAATDALTGNRLSDPLGYWNSLGLWAAMALALGVVLVGRGRSIELRVACAASCVPSAATLYFTFSRGAWIALVAGFLVAFAVDPRRLGLLVWTSLALLWPAVGVFLASRSSGLAGATPTLEHARADGHRLALVLVVLAVASALTVHAVAQIERRWRAPRGTRRAFAGLLIGVCVLTGAAAVAQLGAPWTIARHAVHRFESPPGVSGGNLNARLFQASGSGRVYLWRVAWHDARRHPVVGSGAGSYAGEWYRHRTVASDATNAHDLYLETLAELGPAGLALLVVALGAPLCAAWRARRHPLAAGATAAYVAFLVHVSVDWDWQLAAVGLAALCSGASLMIMARTAPSRSTCTVTRSAFAAYGVLLAGFALWSLQGSHPLGQARDAIEDGRWASAQAQASDAVARIGGFSADAWRLLGESQTALGNRNAARASLRVAVSRDPSSWEAWYDLANVTRGAERNKAARMALALNPLGSETRSLARVAGIPPRSP